MKNIFYYLKRLMRNIYYKIFIRNIFSKNIGTENVYLIFIYYFFTERFVIKMH